MVPELDVAVGACRVRSWRSEAPWDARATAHAGVEIAWVSEGAVEYAAGAKRFAMTGDAVAIVPCDVEHASRSPAALRAASVHVRPEIVAEIADAMGVEAPRDPVLVPSAPKVRAVGRLLARAIGEGGADALVAADALLEALVLAALRAGDGRRRVDPAIDRVRRRIDACYAEPLDIAVLAREAGMSRYHFSRRFREEVGRPPYDYLLDVRVERAAALLRDGRRVTEAAFATGFGDLGRFGKRFRARFGVTPSAYARATAH